MDEDWPVVQNREQMIEREARKNLMLAGAIEAGEISAPVRIRNLSEGGAMIEGAALPETGSTIVLRRLELSIMATVVWRLDNRCGVRFHGRAAVDEWSSGTRSPDKPGSLGQLRVDRIQAAVREGAVLPVEERLPATAPDEELIEARIAAELADVRQALEAATDELAGDGDVLMRHQKALQSLDIAGAILGSLSDVMGATDRAGAIERIQMHDLRSRLSGRGTLK